jgi:predicted TIM-barrel fold metal-dependent hydrolase
MTRTTPRNAVRIVLAAMLVLVGRPAFSVEPPASAPTRAVRDVGSRGVFVESAKGDLLLDASQARPVLQAAAELGVPVFAHPINPQPLSRQLAPYGRLGTLLARGTVNAATLVALLEGGVFDEIPSLQVVVTTLAIGGVLLAGGFGEASGVRTDAATLLRRHVYIDTMNFHPVLIRAAVESAGGEPRPGRQRLADRQRGAADWRAGGTDW